MAKNNLKNLWNKVKKALSGSSTSSKKTTRQVSTYSPKEMSEYNKRRQASSSSSKKTTSTKKNNKTTNEAPIRTRTSSEYSSVNNNAMASRKLIREIETKTKSDIAPIKKKKKEDDEKYFKKGAFEDGYQVGDVTKTAVGTVGDAFVNVAKTVGNMGETFVDLGRYGVAGVSDLVGADDFANKQRVKAMENTIDKNFKELEEGVDEWSILGGGSDNVVQGLTQMASIILTGGIGASAGLGSAGVTALTTGMMGLSGMGSGMSEAYQSGATDKEAFLHGVGQGTADAVPELMFAGMGKTIKALGFSRGLTSLDDVFAQKLTNKISNQFAKNLVQYGVKSSAEGLEEVVSGIGSAVSKKLTYASDEELMELIKDENLLDQFVVGAVTSGVAQSGLVPGMKQGSLLEANKTGRDFITGYTQNEQKVVDKEIENRTAKEIEKKIETRKRTKISEEINKAIEKAESTYGTLTEEQKAEIRADVTSKMDFSNEDFSDIKLTKKEQGKISDRVNEAIERGEIDTFTIEDTLFRDSALRMRELNRELETATPERKAEIEAELNTLREDFNKELDKNGKLKESYRQKALENETLDYKLDENASDKAKKIVQSAIESGENNTRRAHERIDLAIKLAEDSDFNIEFVNDEQLEQLGYYEDVKDLRKKLREAQTEAERSEIQYAIEEARNNRTTTINGIKVSSQNKIILNVNSKKALETVLGHEVTHFTEKAGDYGKLKDFLKEYADSKGDYSGRVDSISKTYKRLNPEFTMEEIEQEVTADLVGEYVFTDEDFIRSLSAKQPNIFKQTYDYIKHVFNMATAGSHEARQLEQAKRMFEKVYRETAKAKNSANTKTSTFKSINGEEIEVDRISDRENDVSYSISYASDIAKGQSDYIVNKKGYVTESELAKAHEVTQAMVDVMMKYSSILPEDKIGKVLTKNGSYDRSVENTTICVRTLAYNEFVDKVQEEIGRPLTQMESFLVSQKLYDIATEPQCMYCYVSLDRKSFNEMLLRYMSDRDTVIDKYNKSDKSDKAISELYEEFLNGRKDTKPMKDRFNKWISDVDNGVPLLSLADISTEERQSVIKSKGGELAKQLADARKYAQSASWSKIQKNYVAYKDEILKLGDRVVKNLNEHYGLRWYSFSDYSPAFIVENMQQITDASIRGLKGLSYTKDTDYAEIFAPSGMNINVSVFVNQDENGNFYIDEKQSANFERAKELREKYPNVGIVATVTNDEALRWAGSQEWSDVIIPFHIVRTGTDVAQYYKWLNYTSESADTIKDKNLWDAYVDSLNIKSENARKKVSKNIYPNEHKNDKTTYLTMCETRGLTPRFGRFAGEEWYMKLVNETRLSADESVPLKPNYDLESAQSSFQKFIKKGGYEGGWYKDGVDVDAEAREVASDVLAGKKANEVDYGRQDNFDPEKILGKRKTNRNHMHFSLSEDVAPVKDNGVQYSLSDSDGNKLTKEQREYFKDSKVRDEKGNLKVMYHGTEKGGFHEFIPGFSDDETSFFFTDNNETAKSYSGTHENYVAQTLRTADDFNKFFASVNADNYEVREENGQFVLYEDGDEVATSDTADGIYEEFRDWTGLGYGSSNYKVYLDIKNPLVVDADGNNWDDLDRVSKGNKKVYDTLSAKMLPNWNFEYRYWDEKGKQISGEMSEQEFVKTFGQKFFEEVVENDSEFNTVRERLVIDTDTGKEVLSTTREYSQYAKENGYDGVIFNNIIDNGLYASGEERFNPSTVAIAFDSKQIKSVDNKQPTSDADIRYSLSDDYAPLTEARANERDAQQRGGIFALNDDDMPPEFDTPYYEELDTEPVNPFDERDIDDVGKKNVKAYMYENPEVKPFFQEEAQIMLRELQDSTKGVKEFNSQLYYETGGEQGWFGTKRQTSEEVAYLLDRFNYTYADIEKGLKAIIEDHGAENNAVSKRIEFMIDERLREGYTDFTSGYDIPNNPDYIDLLKNKNITEYTDEAYNNWLQSLADEEPNDVGMVEDIAPVRAESIKPRPEVLEGEEAEMTNNPIVRADSTETKSKTKQRKWVKTSTESEAVNKKIVPEDLDQNAINYQPIHNKKTLGIANSRLDNMGYDTAVSYFKGQFTNRDVKLEDVALGERLIQEAMKREDYDTARELIQDVSILGTELGQKVQALSIIQRLTPEGQLRTLRRTIERARTKGDKAFDGVELTPEMEEKILRARKKDGTFDQKELTQSVEDVKQELADQMKVTATEKINAWRYLSMLGNPKTHIRNLVSNIAMKGTLSVKNAVARTVEEIAPVKNRTKTWKSSSEDVKAYAKEMALEYRKTLADGSKYNDTTGLKEKRDIFKNKILNGMYEFNSNLLQKEDWWFSTPAFEKSFREFLTANGIETKHDIAENIELVNKAKAYATEQAQIATFQQYSWLANKIGEMERKNALTNMAVGSVLPFKKTPINIAKTGLNYSPLGFAKTLTYDIAEVKKGNMEASTLVDHLAQNTTGTALTLIGYMLAMSGILNGSGDDDKEGTYDYQLGKQSYSINIGDSSFSLSWLTPVAMPLFVGANAYEQLVEGQEWNGDVVVETLAQTLDPLSEMSFLSSLDSVLSSYDSGIQKFAGIGETAFQNYATQFIPTLSSQLASTMDDTKRSTKVSGDSGFKMFDETLNKLKYKIPGLRETLEPSTDIWGNEVKQTENLFGRAFENFIAPYSRKEYIATSIDEELKDLYSETGEDGLLPSIPYNYLNYNGEKYKMSADEYTLYKKRYGQIANDMLDDLFRTSTYQNASSEERAEMVEHVYDYSREDATKKYLARKGVEFTNATKDGVEYYREDAITTVINEDIPLDEANFKIKNPEKYDFLKHNNITYTQYKVSKQDESTARMYDWAYENPEYYQVARAISSDLSVYWKHNGYMYNNIRADKDANGKSISGSKKRKIIEYLNSAYDLTLEEKMILFKKYYPSDDTYNYEIVDYLNSRDDMTYEEKKMVLVELDFKVDSQGNITW